MASQINKIQFQKKHLEIKNFMHVLLKENKVLDLKSLTLLKKCTFRHRGHGSKSQKK
jgi:hypothetical protein